MKSISPENLSQTFGYKSGITRKTVSELCNLIQINFSEFNTDFNNWEIFFNEAGGYKAGKIINVINDLKESYSINKNIEYNKVLFSFHTYFSILVRWLTYRIIKPTDNHESHFRDFNPKVISAFFKNCGINNFGETEYFDWFYNVKSDALIECFNELSSIIENFDTGLLNNDYEIKNDLLKLLYQNLFPPKIRHHLGEYYTPDWVAKLAIESSGYDYDPAKRILDPSCGSGTFLLQVLNGIQTKNNGQNDKTLAKTILENIWGFDLNPLAVLSAKSNYIIFLKDFLPLKESSDIPVYQFDSIAFENPYLVNSEQDLFKQNNFNTNHFTDVPDKIKESKFDYIFGNPPWINWKSLPDYYRAAVLPHAEKYNLFEHKGLKARLGFAQDDVSVIMTYVVIDHFLKDNGILSFILPQTLFKTFGGGTGFRQFKLGKEGKPLKVISVQDLSNIKVFDTAASRAAIITIKKNEPTVYPVQYNLWTKIMKSGKGHKIDLENSSFSIQHAIPVKEYNSNWITADKDILDILLKNIRASTYRARAGVCSWASSIYWLEILDKKPDYWLVRNYTDSAKIKQRIIQFEVEPDFVYELVRGSNIKRWHFESELSILLPQSPQNFSKSIDEKTLLEFFPKTNSYLSKFKKSLLERKGYKKFLFNSPYYSVYDIGNYTLSPYKVAWKYIDVDLRAAVLEGGHYDKPYIPDLNVITISTDDRKEAHYLCSFLNSSFIRLIIQTFGLCTRITPGILNYLPIAEYDSKNKFHTELSRLSIECHKHYKNETILLSNQKEIDFIIGKIINLSEEKQKRIMINLNFYLGN